MPSAFQRLNRQADLSGMPSGSSLDNGHVLFGDPLLTEFFHQEFLIPLAFGVQDHTGRVPVETVAGMKSPRVVIFRKPVIHDKSQGFLLPRGRDDQKTSGFTKRDEFIVLI